MKTKRQKIRPNGKQKRAHSDEMTVYISPILFVMAVFFVAMGMAYELACSLAAVLLHECAHAKVAKKLGYELNTVKLMPYGAALCGQTDILPKHEVIIALAGPLFNAVVAVLFVALWWLVPSGYVFTSAFCFSNLYIGLFNLIPVYPMDGGRVVLGLLSCKMPRTKAYKIMRIISAVCACLALSLFVASVFFTPNISLLAVGIFMTVSALFPNKDVGYRAVFSLPCRAEKLRRPLDVRRYAVVDSCPLGELVSVLDGERFTEFAVYNGEMTVRAIITETEVVNAVKRYGYDKTVDFILNKVN